MTKQDERRGIEFDGSTNTIVNNFTIMLWSDNPWVVYQFLLGKFKGY